MTDADACLILHFKIWILDDPEEIAERILNGGDNNSFANILERLIYFAAFLNQRLQGFCGVFNSPVGQDVIAC